MRLMRQRAYICVRVYVFPDRRIVALGNMRLKCDMAVSPGWHYARLEIGKKFVLDII